MQLSSAATFVVGALAAFRGMDTAPVPTSPPGNLQLTDISNRTLPPALDAMFTRNFHACLDNMERNPRIFRAQTEVGQRALCTAQAGMGTALSSALSAAASEIALVREGIHRLAESFSTNPVQGLDTAGHTAAELLAINFRDYRESGTSSYRANRDRLVARLEQQVPESQRHSMKAARAAANASPHVEDRAGLMKQLARKEISERIGMAIQRSIGSPDSITMEQLDDLREDLKELQFGNTALKRRMLKDALTVLVENAKPA